MSGLDLLAPGQFQQGPEWPSPHCPQPGALVAWNPALLLRTDLHSFPRLWLTATVADLLRRPPRWWVRFLAPSTPSDCQPPIFLPLLMLIKYCTGDLVQVAEAQLEISTKARPCLGQCIRIRGRLTSDFALREEPLSQERPGCFKPLQIFPPILCFSTPQLASLQLADNPLNSDPGLIQAWISKPAL